MQEHYLVQHLKKYIKYELQQGYKIDDIKAALIRYGYKKKLIQHASSQIKYTQPRQLFPKLSLNYGKPPKKQLTDDMRLYIQSMLIDYIKRQRKQFF